MAIDKKTEFIVERSFDPVRCRHTVNGQVNVLHCHHYLSLYAQLAEDCGMLDARKLLKETAEDAFYRVLSDYYRQNGVESTGDRIAIAEQYYSFCGLGSLKVLAAGQDSGEVELTHSHVDSGWIKKWGNRSKPVNYVTCGYIDALFAAVFGLQPRSFEATETASIVAGAERSEFVVTAR
jgi:hypothetical protein